MTAPLIDVRSHQGFVAAHVPGSTGIPLEELSVRSHELPTRSTPLAVMDRDDQRARRAAEILRTRGHPVTIISFDHESLTERGNAYVRLWQPNEFLVESLAQIEHHETLKATPRALDIACGSGRDAVYLAMHGYEVEAIDVLPDALAKASDLARRCGIALSTRTVNLERDPQLPKERYDLVIVFRYLHRALFPLLREALAIGGYIACETFHERNLKTGLRPRDPAHLLKPGELRAAFDGFEILIDRDGVERDGRFFSSVLAHKPTTAR